MSSIISQDITSDVELSSQKDDLSQRDLMIFKAYENTPWTENDISDRHPITTVNRDLLFQILMVENISKSKQSQLDDINTKINPKTQRVDRLNASKINLKSKRPEFVAQIDLDSDDDSSPSFPNHSLNNSEKDMFKFTIQGRNGLIFFAINTFPIKWGNCTLGAKIIIKKGTIFNKNIFILRNNTNVTFLGGINRIWNENRNLKLKDYLTAKLNRDRINATTTSGSRKRKATDIR